MGKVSLTALSGILLERAYRSLGSAVRAIENFGDLVSFNKTYMLMAKEEIGKAEAYLEVMRIMFPRDHSYVISSEEYKKAIKLVADTEKQLNRY